MKKQIILLLILSIIIGNVGCSSNKTETISDRSAVTSSDSADEAVTAEKEKEKSQESEKSDSNNADISYPDADPEDELIEITDSFDENADAETIENEEAGIIVDESRKNEILNQVKAGSLDIENDTFEFEKLISLVGLAENELIELIGAEGHPEKYETMLFGEKVLITSSVEDSLVSEIRMVFTDTDSELLANAITEQIGTDPQNIDKTLIWEYSGNTIKQQDSEEGVLVTINAASA